MISHVPCGGNPWTPPGRVQITATLDKLDGDFLGTGGPTQVWTACGIPSRGAMIFNIDRIDTMESEGVFQAVVEHEMGHVLGIG